MTRVELYERVRPNGLPYDNQVIRYSGEYMGARYYAEPRNTPRRKPELAQRFAKVAAACPTVSQLEVQVDRNRKLVDKLTRQVDSAANAMGIDLSKPSPAVEQELSRKARERIDRYSREGKYVPYDELMAEISREMGIDLEKYRRPKSESNVVLPSLPKERHSKQQLDAIERRAMEDMRAGKKHRSFNEIAAEVVG